MACVQYAAEQNAREQPFPPWAGRTSSAGPPSPGCFSGRSTACCPGRREGARNCCCAGRGLASTPMGGAAWPALEELRRKRKERGSGCPAAAQVDCATLAAACCSGFPQLFPAVRFPGAESASYLRKRTCYLFLFGRFSVPCLAQVKNIRNLQT